MVSFRLLNLIGDWPALPPMDIVLLRNVMVYFETDMKRRVLSRVRGQLCNDGYLFLGGVETTLLLDDAFVRIQHGRVSYYQLAPAFTRRQVGVTRIHAARCISQARIETSSLGPERPHHVCTACSSAPTDSLMATPRLAVSNSTIRALPNSLSSPSMASGTPSEYRNTRSPG